MNGDIFLLGKFHASSCFIDVDRTNVLGDITVSSYIKKEWLSFLVRDVLIE